ncbi:MAG: hypothetical protein IT385_28090 [Deltaproteobacteria bacterium]|nr:hypothetical protein [Deltaproteobacteria bacterium]
MAEDIDDLSVNWDEGGTVTVEQLDKQILSRGSWVTILFKYREQNQKTQVWTPPKFTLRRYQKRNGVYRQQSKFNISSFAQAKAIVTALDHWIKESEAAGVSDDAGGDE